MTRFVVRPTSCYESDGYSVVDTNREDERGKQIGRGLHHGDAWDLATLLSNAAFRGNDNQVRAVLAACADAHDDYLSADEKRASREAHEKSAEQASKMPAALRECLGVLEQSRELICGGSVMWGDFCDAAIAKAREALGE